MKPKISIFTSSHNHSKDLKLAIESVLNQTYENFEYFLFDDGSSDSTYDIMKSYEYDKRVRIIKLNKQPNVGVIINKSIKLSTGEYWSWCPADDYWKNNLLERKIEYTKIYPNSVLYNNFSYMNEKGEIYKHKHWGNITSDRFSENIWKTDGIGFTGIFIPMYIFNDLNIYFPEDLEYSEDFYWMIKANIHGVKFDVVPEILHVKRKHINSLTHKRRTEIIANVPNIRKELKEYEKCLKIR